MGIPPSFFLSFLQRKTYFVSFCLLPRSTRPFRKGIKLYLRVQIENEDKTEIGIVASPEFVSIHLNVKKQNKTDSVFDFVNALADQSILNSKVKAQKSYQLVYIF